jgi:hypothetical protein
MLLSLNKALNRVLTSSKKKKKKKEIPYINYDFNILTHKEYLFHFLNNKCTWFYS